MALKDEPQSERRVSERKAVPDVEPGPGSPVMLSADALGAELRKPAADYAKTAGRGDKLKPGDADFGAKLVQLSLDADRTARMYFTNTCRTAWDRAYKAYRNEHFSGSKYLSNEYKGRSKIYRPKTRTAVRKEVQVAAQALFATPNVVQIGPGNEADPRQRASAAIKQQLVNYRLSRQSPQAAVPWFIIASGAQQNAALVGVCCSKQYWCREVEYEDQQQPVMGEAPLDPMTGQPQVDPQTGQPMEAPPQIDPKTGQPMMEKVTVERVVKDRPDIILYPPENVRIDPTADWTDPINTAAYVLLDIPMTVDAVMDMMTKEHNTKSEIEWEDIDREQLETRTNFDADRDGVRRSREGGPDRYRDSQASDKTHWSTVWVRECFIRYEGTDWHFFMAGSDLILSKPKPCKEAYPAFNGSRPIVYGYGQIEAHRINPMSKASAMASLQIEANDIANLRLDQLKNVVTPLAKVKRGADVDTEMLKRRGPGVTIAMRDPASDLIWDTPPDVPASAYNEQNLLNADIDDLNGSFSGSSVATNRALNETVGGMNLMSGAANAATEFDLRVWIETWAEPVLAQIVKLEEYYESDEVVLGLCGARAKLLEQHGVSVIDDDLLNRQVTCSINAGIGASDPMQKMQKLDAAFKIAGPILAPGVQSGEVKINYKEVADEVFGSAGFADAGERFLTINDSGQVPPPPEVQAAQMEQQQKQAELQAKQAEAQDKSQYQQAMLNFERDKFEQQLESNERMQAAELANKLALAEIASSASVTGTLVGKMADARMADAAHQRDMQKLDATGSTQMVLTHMKGVQGQRQLDAKGQQAKDQLGLKGQQAQDQLNLKGQQASDMMQAKGTQSERLAQLRPGPDGKIPKLPPPTQMPAQQSPMGHIKALADFASASLPIMQEIFNQMQQMKRSQDQGVQFGRGPDGINKVTRGGMSYVPQRDPVTGDITGFAPDQGSPPGPPTGAGPPQLPPPGPGPGGIVPPPGGAPPNGLPPEGM